MDDDEPLRTTREERHVWAGLIAITLASAVYYVRIVPELLHTPAADVSWVAPMFWSMFAGVVGTVLAVVVAEVIVGFRGRDDCEPDGVTVDVRDQEIGRRGGRFALPFMGVGLGVALILASKDVDGFWIGNAVFLCSLAATIAEAVVKLRLYRRGF
ncbi:hypothetical protein [Actinoplanes palleronii]|uniref:Tripartite tricarboxylate transporter TctB family protein n=1 Tax=Actinoplanes palleronii TaxID=113570 RepID=A0ABQ4BIH1_9ACTN|nr:hypothetical protein [Actinoplanes palleronii]GIE70469.1 hypothetical protein Apa02nite_065770 [Actinoplanes palleronii]